MKISMENITYYGNYLSYQKKEQQSRMVYYAFDHREIHWFNSVLGAHVAALFFFYFINETNIYKILYTKAHPRQMQTIHATKRIKIDIFI